MKKPERTAEYYLSEIRKDVLETLTTEQKNEIKSVLKRSLGLKSDKLVDANITFWFIRKMFMTVYLGFDKRKEPRPSERKRDVFVGIFIKVLIYGSLLTVVLTILFFSLYMIKSKIGIDIFPDKHLRDFF